MFGNQNTQENLKRLSSSMTIIQKFIFPTLWIGGFGFGTLTLWLGAMTGKNGNLPPYDAKWGFLLMWIAGSIFILWGCAGLKKVILTSDSLIVSNYFREITIPVEMIERVTENCWINIRPVTVHFRCTTDFGERITFMPKIKLFLLFWKSHPVIEELRQATASKNRKNVIP